jgi:hypothetical protein
MEKRKSQFDSALLLQMLDELDEVSFEYNQKDCRGRQCNQGKSMGVPGSI